ncbi:MAG: exosome complex protein Rrp42 [archaeon]|nr:exosome complex protein Rrp42 [archaeon]
MMEISDIVSVIEKKYIIKLLKQGKRIDGRGLNDFRDVKVEVNQIPKAEGSADVKVGDSRVICGIKYDVGTPFEDSPDEGVATCMTEFIPFASPMFESGPPSIQAIEVARVVDRGIRHGDCIEYKKLCIKAGEWVYIIFIDLYVMDYFGNLIDTGAIAAIAALLSAKIPTAKYNKETGKPEWDGKYMKIPIKQIPISISFGKIGNYVILDPSLPEELVLDGKISYAINEKGEICSIQKAYKAIWSQEEIIKYSKIAVEKANELREKLNLRQYAPKI